MRFTTYSHRHAGTLFACEEPYLTLWHEVSSALDGISDDDLIQLYETKYANSMSISAAINELIRDRLIPQGWSTESPIFADPKYNARSETRWRLDFAKDEVSIEVAFNHGEASAWNLLKPVLASELNHVKKAIQTSAGILICATEAMKKAGSVRWCRRHLRKLRQVPGAPQQRTERAHPARWAGAARTFLGAEVQGGEQESGRIVRHDVIVSLADAAPHDSGTRQ